MPSCPINYGVARLPLAGVGSTQSTPAATLAERMAAVGHVLQGERCLRTAIETPGLWEQPAPGLVPAWIGLGARHSDHPPWSSRTSDGKNPQAAEAETSVQSATARSSMSLHACFFFPYFAQAQLAL